MAFDIGIWAMVGFVFAAYAVVGNDALQTLGTFINSNRQLHWTVLFAFASLVLVITFTYGWTVNGGDPSYGRLANESKYPVVDIQWYHVLPPAVLLLITRLGIPVSTSFMVLTIFASVGGLTSMISKSLVGYGLAFLVGGLIYAVTSRTMERWFQKNEPGSIVPRGLIAGVGIAYLLISQFLLGLQASGGQLTAMEVLASLFTQNTTLLTLIGIVIAFEITANVLARQNRALYWVTAQWLTTGYLWGVWLIQDFANIFVFLPRELTPAEGFGAMAVIVILLGITFANNGGPVQRILRTKTSVTDIRSATVIDLIYASLLFFFKEYSDIPMSTTWVFLGLIAGREYAFALIGRAVQFTRAFVDTIEDVSKAFIGIVLSIDLAIILPTLGMAVAGEAVVLPTIGFADGGLALTTGTMFETQSLFVTFLVANLAMVPILFFAFSQPEVHLDRAHVTSAGVMGGLLLVLVALFFVFLA